MPHGGVCVTMSADLSAAEDAGVTLPVTQALSDDDHAEATWSHGHTTPHATELLYWLGIVQDHVRSQRSGTTCSDDEDSADDGDTTAEPRARMYTSLATALVRWTEHTFRKAGILSSRCPRVWVPVRHDDGPSHRQSLVLRPVCEHPECLHAVRTQSRRAKNDVTSLVATHNTREHVGSHGVNGNHVSTVPLCALAERSGQVLAVLTEAAAYGDDSEQLLHHDNVSAAIDALRAAVPINAQVSIQRLSDLHEALRKPLRWVQVVADTQRVGSGAGHALSHLWLCAHHANDAEMARLREREQQFAEAVSMSVEWNWHDGRGICVFDHLCTATLEHAFRTKRTEVDLHCSDHRQTVQFLPSGMVVKGSGARVGRVPLKTYVCVYGCIKCCGRRVEAGIQLRNLTCQLGRVFAAIRFRHIGMPRHWTTTQVSS